MKSLVERVIVTKRLWGSPSLEVEELARVYVYPRLDGTIIVTKWEA